MILKLVKYYFSLHYWQGASIVKVRKMQLKKFRTIFEYARENSAFYKDFYGKHGVLDLKIESFDDIQKVPIIDKNILKQYDINDIVTCKLTDKHNIHSTSGSTGEPFKIAYSKFEDYSAHVRLTRYIMKHGYNPFKKMVLISRYESGHQFEVEKDVGLIAKLQRALKIFPKEIISIFEPLDLVIEKLIKIKPFIIWSTPSFIHLLALELEKKDLKLEIPVCFLMAETISPDQLKLFKERVCKKLIDAYGSMESPSIGFSTSNIDYKDITHNTFLIEVINHREINNAKVGDIVTTNFINKTMPFIRYEMGDYVGVLDRPDFPIKRIGKVYGRFEDILDLGNNNTLSFHQTYQLFHSFHEIEQYKFVQMISGDIIMQLRLKAECMPKDVIESARSIWEKYYPTTPIKIEVTDKFEIDSKTGKFKVLEKLRK
jgi:phenylacetate-CoA ligase